MWKISGQTYFAERTGENAWINYAVAIIPSAVFGEMDRIQLDSLVTSTKCVTTAQNLVEWDQSSSESFHLKRFAQYLEVTFKREFQTCVV